jgi:hypothetical protein
MSTKIETAPELIETVGGAAHLLEDRLGFAVTPLDAGH